jgi:NAD(P)H-dependent FMN reductase
MSKAVKKLKKKAEEADAILFVTPEINGSVSPLVLNAFVWLSRAKNKELSPLQYKKAAIISASYLSENPIVDCI